ncbi:MAG: ABC transporter permease subunit, partial [Bacteroidota bacterium]
MRYFLRYLRRDADQWSALVFILTLCIAVPLLMVLWHLPEGPGELWPHIRTYLLPTYVSNSLLLLGGTSVGCILLGVAPAWIVSRYSFPGRRTIAWLLLLPLAIPSYIMAYAYVGLSESLSPYSLRVDFMNLPGLIWVLSLALYPYVYGGCRALFQHFPRNLQDSSYMLGATEGGFFFRVALPLATPAILAGIFLVSMEVLNDYGAAKYYGVNTFTTGIFRTWTALEDLPAAIYLAAILIVLVGILMALLQWLRDRRNYAVKASDNQGKAARLPLRGRSVLIGLPLVLFPLVCGFVLPVVQLGYWAWRSFELSFLQELLEVSLQSFAVAASGAGSVCLLALLLLFSSRWNALRYLSWFT